MKTYEIRASRIVYDFYEVEANSLQEAENLALCSTDKVNTFETGRTKLQNRGSQTPRSICS